MGPEYLRFIELNCLIEMSQKKISCKRSTIKITQMTHVVVSVGNNDC